MVPARAVRTAASLSARLFICFPMAFIGGRPLTSSGVMARTPCAHGSLLVIVPAIARAVRSVSNIGWLQRKKKCRLHDVQDPGLITQERSFVPMRLDGMSSVAEIARPLARAINIYCSVAGCGIDLCTRRDLARHIRGLAEQGVDDPGRLTVHGLSYLRNRSHNVGATGTDTGPRKGSGDGTNSEANGLVHTPGSGTYLGQSTTGSQADSSSSNRQTRSPPSSVTTIAKLRFLRWKIGPQSLGELLCYRSAVALSGSS